MKINLLEFFDDTVRNCPQKTAVIDGEREITFGVLDAEATVLANRILKTIQTKNNPIAVFLPKCIEAVVCDIAISKSANAFMNLDIKTPPQRISNILELIQPSVIITDSRYYELVKSVSKDLAVINIDDIDWKEDVDRNRIDCLKEGIIDTDPFCIINTSGSTGTPKGVALSHLNFIDFIYRSQEAFNLSSDEIMGSLSPIVFDIYVLELCLLMYKSTTIVLIPSQLSAFPAKILKIMNDTEVSFIFWVPTIMVNIANMGLLDSISLPYLKLVWFAGEVFPTKQFNVWRHSLSHTTFANLYGPIETAVDSIFYVINREIPDNEPIPIGYAYRNTDILLLDDYNKQVIESGKEGEICVRGSSLALGYYNNPEKTASAFVQNPLNSHYPERIYRTGDIAAINSRGEIVFRGRKDSLIKHQGYRIELGEVEHVIVNTLHLVKNGCVVYRYQSKDIILFYENENELTPMEFRRELAKDLPKYMIPTVYSKVDILQRNTNGKIDRLYYKNLANE